MFGIDPYSFETLWPSLLGIGLMTGAMLWGAAKVLCLMRRDSLKAKK